MELHFPAANFAADPAAVASDVFDFENRAKVLADTGYLTVYVSDKFVLREVCSLDELRFVAGLLASMHIGHVAMALTERSLSNYNGARCPLALAPYMYDGKPMLEMVEEGVSPLIHLAGIAAFLEQLPLSPKVRNSAPEAEALQRLAKVGERIWHNNIVELKDNDHRLWTSSYKAGLARMRSTGCDLSARHQQLIEQVLRQLDEAGAILVLDKVNL